MVRAFQQATPNTSFFVELATLFSDRLRLLYRIVFLHRAAFKISAVSRFLTYPGLAPLELFRYIVTQL